MTLQNKVILVTGGTGNLGRMVVETFLEAGAELAVNYRSVEAFERLRSATSSPERLWGIAADLTSEKEVRMLFEQMQKRQGHLDALIHLVGGFWMGGDLAETPFEKWHQMLRDNLLTTFFCTREAMSLMKKQGFGKIFTIASKTALELPAGMGAYSVSKAAVVALTETLAKEGQPYNVQAVVLLPSIIDTESNRRSMPDANFQEWVKPQEIANILLALCEERITGISGTMVKLYGKL